MRVLVVCEGLSGGSGWQTYAKTLCGILKNSGDDVFTCTSDGDGDHPVLHPPMRYLSRPWARWMDAWRLWRIVETVQPDIIHIAVEPFTLAAMLLPRRWGMRTVVTLHGTYAVWLCKKPAVIRWIIRQRVRCIAVSFYTKWRCVAEAGDALLDFLDVVYTGIAGPRARSKPVNPVPQILLVGGVKARKGVKEAIAAVALYQKRYGKVRFFVVGSFAASHPYVTEVLRMIDALRLRDVVVLTGRIDDAALDALYATTDLYLMPSETLPHRFEGFGLVFLEAAARGIPCIGSDDGGGAEAIGDGITGYKVSPSDTEALVDRMHRVLVQGCISPEACRRFGAAFTHDSMSKGVRIVYAKRVTDHHRTVAVGDAEALNECCE